MRLTDQVLFLEADVTRFGAADGELAKRTQVALVGRRA